MGHAGAVALVDEAVEDGGGEHVHHGHSVHPAVLPHRQRLGAALNRARYEEVAAQLHLRLRASVSWEIWRPSCLGEEIYIRVSNSRH